MKSLKIIVVGIAIFALGSIFAAEVKINDKVINVKKEVGKSILGYIRAYSIIMGITFIITFICFIKVKCSITTSYK